MNHYPPFKMDPVYRSVKYCSLKSRRNDLITCSNDLHGRHAHILPCCPLQQPDWVQESGTGLATHLLLLNACCNSRTLSLSQRSCIRYHDLPLTIGCHAPVMIRSHAADGYKADMLLL